MWKLREKLKVHEYFYLYLKLYTTILEIAIVNIGVPTKQTFEINQIYKEMKNILINIFVYKNCLQNCGIWRFLFEN